MKKLKIKFFSEQNIFGFAINVSENDDLNKLRKKVKKFISKRYNIRIFKLTQIKVEDMKNTMVVKDLKKNIVNIHKEEMIEDIEDNIINIYCKVCFIPKEHPEDRCLMCGNFKCDIEIY